MILGLNIGISWRQQWYSMLRSKASRFEISQRILHDNMNIASAVPKAVD